jgi:predicted RNA-binding protein with PUA-like domain
MMAYWLLKSEPDVYSFDDLKKSGNKGSEWTGIRNYLARNNMRTMKIGDKAFFYHSNIGLEIVGVAEVTALSHPDSTTDDPRWDCVDIRAVIDMPRPVTRNECKLNPKLEKMVLVVSTRLSVQPVTTDEWAEICAMGGLTPVPR